MKTIKPMHVGVLCRTFDKGGRLYFVSSLFILFDLGRADKAAAADQRIDVPLPEAELWQLAEQELPEQVALDEGMHKSHGELLVHAVAHPVNPPQSVCKVRVAVGDSNWNDAAGAEVARAGEHGRALIDKTLYVLGDRVWRGGKASEPVPFAEQRLGWHNAFGGAGVADNPLGRGAAATEEDGNPVHRLPNVERPDALVLSPRDRPKPAGFGAIDALRPARLRRAGTPVEGTQNIFEDIDWSYFNVAPEDQWLDGFFAGNEQVLVEHLHPELARMATRLPGLCGRCFIRRRGNRGLEEVPLRLDTVQLFPHRERGILTWRGVTEVSEDDCEDIDIWLSACERIGEAKPLSHYERAVANRLDPKRAQFYAMRDSDFVPTGTMSAMATADTAELVMHETLMLDNFKRGLHMSLQEAKERAAEEGFDMQLPEPEPEPDYSDIDALPDLIEQVEQDIARHKQEIDEQMAKAMAEAERRAADLGLDYAAVRADADARSSGPPDFDAAQEHAKMLASAELCRNAGMPMVELEAQLGDPQLIERLLKLQSLLEESYRSNAQWYPPAAAQTGEQALRGRAQVVATVQAGNSLARTDLTGLDLSELDLSQADLSGAFMEACDLRDADLSGANLEGAVLVRAKLTRTKLAGAKLSGVNLSAAQLDETDFGEQARLDRIVFIESKLNRVKLAGAALTGCDFMGAKLHDCDLSGLDAHKSMFFGIELTGANLTRSRLAECVFVKLSARDIDLSHSDLTSTTFITCEVEGAKLDHCDADNLRILAESRFDGASFRHAKLQTAAFASSRFAGGDFRDAELSHSNLTKCCFDEADFTHAKAVDAVLTRSSFRHARLIGVDLRGALLPNADLRDADLSGSQLFRADLTRVYTSGGTKLDAAEIRYCRFTRRQQPAEALDQHE